jgi:predicted nucleotidyltransferase
MDVELPGDFKEFLQSLTDHGVKYLLIGGYAVGFHGYPRATNDIDVWIRMSNENADRMVAALTDFGFADPILSADLFLQEHNIIRMGRPPLRVEIATTVSGVDFDDCFKARVIAAMDGILVPVISREHLLANKRAAGRLKDLADVQALEQRNDRGAN